ncbi:MAG: hypothetical protein ACHQ7M_16775 [Chloroflexota bacterium]
MIDRAPVWKAVKVGVVLPLDCGMKPGALQNIKPDPVKEQVTVLPTLMALPSPGLHETVVELVGAVTVYVKVCA